jgi:hypothetical protein
MNIADGKSSLAANRTNPLLDVLATLRRVVSWLATIFILTEEEQVRAGIYFGNERYE